MVAGAWLRGQRVLQRRGLALADGARAAGFVAAVALVAAALSWPLLPLSQSHLLARMAQKVAICLIAAPLFWLAFPFHTIAAGAPAALRRRATALLLRAQAWTPALRAATSPAPAWFVYISAFLIWHDPGFVQWEMAHPLRQVGALAVLLVAALLFWQQVTLGGPRRLASATYGMRILMLVGTEVPNVVAGITIAFGFTSLYQHYAQTAVGPAPFFSQQSLSGALTWVFGSAVYIGSIVAVVNQVFVREGLDRPQPPLNWDAHERMIAPGLEGRLLERDARAHDWGEK